MTNNFHHRIYKALAASVIVMAAIIIAWNSAAYAQSRGGSIIRDTEIENIINEWSAPILKASGVGSNGVNVVLVQNNALNAFVAGGANIFLYTGLIQRTDSPEELLGVFAHELGHITGGHLIAGRAALERASYESILGTIIGVGAAILTGNGNAAAAGSAIGSSSGTNSFLSHSRVQESSADQAALSFFDKAGLNPHGLGSFLEKLESEELLPASQQSEYVRTHPLTANRIDALKRRSGQSPHANSAAPAEWSAQHARMKAKLVGFINPGRVQWDYDANDTAVPARYAHAIAAYRQNRESDAMRYIDGLIAQEPNNPYFHELRGQMLVDFGRIDAALPSYKRAIEIMPQAPLIRIALAHALIEAKSNKTANLNAAIKHLDRAIQKERRSSRAYRLLATAHGRLGREDVAKLYLAEEAVLTRRYGYARQQAVLAKNTLPKTSKEYLRANDILAYLETIPQQAILESAKRR